MLEPQLLEPQRPTEQTSAANAAPIRLLDTQARGHIGRRLLYRQPTGELIEDPTWRWSSSPDRYLDTALRLELASSPGLRLVDAPSAPALAANLVVWHLESGQAGHDWSAQSSSRFTRSRPRRPYLRRASKRARVRRAAGRPGGRRRPTLPTARVGRLDASATRALMLVV